MTDKGRKEEDRSNNDRVGRRLIFWNIAGIREKDRDVWTYLEEGDFISLSETWIEEKSIGYYENIVSKKFNWRFFAARRDNKKGRAKGGFLIGVKKDWVDKNKIKSIEVEEGLIKTELVIGEEKINIWSVYNSGDIEKYWSIWDNIDYLEEETLIIDGDFNIRIGTECAKAEVIEIGKGGGKRISKDTVISNGGKRMIEFIGRKGWTVANGNVRGDEEGDYTFIGARGSSIIDYVIVNEKARDKVIKFKVVDRIESDHVPICLEIRMDEEERNCKRESDGRGEGEDKKLIMSWNEENIMIFEARTTEMEEEEITDDTVEKRWKQAKEMVDKAVVKKEVKRRKWKIGEKKWWDKSCKVKKRKVKKALTDWKKGKKPKILYLTERREWKEMCRIKEKEKREAELEQIKNIKHESEVWQYLNGARNKRIVIENDIGKREWKDHFRTLLEGAEERTVGQERRADEIAEKEKAKITATEIKAAWGMLKKKKAAGLDGIPNEAWIYGGEALTNKLIGIIGKVWEGEGVPEDWKTAIVVPLYKKGEVNETRNYRGISLLPTAYKIYTEVIRMRLVKEVEEKTILPDGQAGFRKGRATVDNIYILEHLIQLAKERKEELYAMFVDLKAAFDTVDRRILWEIMRKAGISKYLIERIKELYYETKVRVRVKDDLSEEFWTEIGLRQGCLLSPILFCIYIAGLEQELKKRNIGGVKIRNERVWSLAYADDIVLLAKNREALNDMAAMMRKFLKDRRMILSVEKTKVLVFHRGRNCKKEKWWWEGKEIEEVKNFKYLGFTFNREGSHKDHIKELERKGSLAVRKVWGLGERKFKGDFRKRKMIFNYLVKSVMSYAAEIWGWREQKELEKIQMDYMRWVLKLDFCTPRYIVYKETDSKKLMCDWGRRAVKYEEKIYKQKDNRLTTMCWLEKLEKGEKDKYSMDRIAYFNRLGYSSLAVENIRRAGKKMSNYIERRETDIEKQEVERMIRESKYNQRYKEIVSEGLPEYLRKYRERKDMELIARIRCGNLEENNRYWLEEKDRLCKLCSKEAGTWEHLVDRCVTVKTEKHDQLEGRRFSFLEIANERGDRNAIWVLRILDRIRKENEAKLVREEEA